MANLRGRLKTTRLITTLRSLKKKLQENLTLSSKLFLRGLLRTFPFKKGKVKKHSFETPSWSEQDFAAAGKPVGHGERAIQTSIVIPVFNKAEFTWQCLGSLVREIDFTRVEIIVVDNASTDNTEAVLTSFADYIRVISNQRKKSQLWARPRNDPVADIAVQVE